MQTLLGVNPGMIIDSCITISVAGVHYPAVIPSKVYGVSGAVATQLVVNTGSPANSGIYICPNGAYTASSTNMITITGWVEYTKV
jgi:hypothetical protein